MAMHPPRPAGFWKRLSLPNMFLDGTLNNRSLIDSKRVSGLVFSERQRLPEVDRKSPLPPRVIKFLLSYVVDHDKDKFDRVVAGFLLFLIFTRAPAVLEYKTSKARDRRGRELPLVAPASLKICGSWALEWLGVR
eukprot:6487444-Amphidinium_carterae.1